MPRTNFTELPNFKELNNILQKESVREPIPLKINKHYIDYSSFGNWLKVIDIKGFEDIKTAEQLAKWSNDSLIQKVVERTIALDSDNPALQDLTEYMCFEDIRSQGQQETADLIMVFGSKSLSRIEKGVDLFKEKRSRFLLISGKSPNYESDGIQIPEALNFYNYAVENGVAKDRILIEPGSMTIAGNVTTSLNLMDNLGVEYKSIAIVTAWFALRRAYAHLMKLGNKDLIVHCYYPEVRSNDLSTDNWHRNETGIRVVWGQWIKTRMPTLLNNTI